MGVVAASSRKKAGVPYFCDCLRFTMAALDISRAQDCCGVCAIEKVSESSYRVGMAAGHILSLPRGNFAFHGGSQAIGKLDDRLEI